MGENKSQFVSILLGFTLFTLIQQGRGKLTKLYCCRGWSDDLPPVNVTPPFLQVDVGDALGTCQGDMFCAKGSTTDCALNWKLIEVSEPPVTATDCFLNQTEKQCVCETNFCNCPAELRDKIPEVPKKPLKCCYGNSRSVDTIEVKEMEDDPLAPCGGRITGDEDSNITDWASGVSFIEYGRLREDCFNWTYKTYGDLAVKYGDICRCHTDLCNCPDSLKDGKTKVPTNSTSTSTPNSTSNSSAPKLHSRPPFSLVTVNAFYSFWSCPLFLALFVPLTLATSSSMLSVQP